MNAVQDFRTLLNDVVLHCGEQEWIWTNGTISFCSFYEIGKVYAEEAIRYNLISDPELVLQKDQIWL